MITIKTPEEIKLIIEGGKRLASVLHEVAGVAKPGVSAIELEELTQKLIKRVGGRPAFLGYKPRGAKKPYPAALCVSVNDEVVHGLPLPEKVFKDGDVVGLDLGLEFQGLYSDTALTVGIGNISKEAKKLIEATKQALNIGILEIKDGATLGDYGHAVQAFAHQAGFEVVRQLVGHGVGYQIHEDPDIPNWGRKGHGLEFKKGMVVALEPMLCEGESDIMLGEDKWAFKLKSGRLSAHFEHTIVVEKNGCKILTKN